MGKLVNKVMSFFLRKEEITEFDEFDDEQELLTAEDAYLFYHWRMSKDSWKELSRGEGDITSDEKFYGSCTIGHLCAEICEDSKTRNLYTNLYVLGKDEGFGYTRSGVPYALAECKELDRFSIGQDFEDFKENFEKLFTKVILGDPEYIDKALSVAGDWN
ncbi:hypothetical protein SAMN06296386_114104 [Lachnospiraceae bacterium]|nr:hypothetical protein SAMN06296386_114104 [Lachnospiraceae bacterium]